ncbi:unnamed protein product [Caenorhabditis angaria]|uniref:Uncharacterized protein n=1 Tax=Caenorhabditis angaria TaxID=860376 RepID=A0A9P1IHD6_9PELO|nr:unnamed protein product [Caenorhabditis angaria]
MAHHFNRAHLDPSTKLNLSLCSRKTYNEMVGRMEYFGTLVLKYIQLDYNFYEIEMSYENNEDCDSYIRFVDYSEEREKRYNEEEDRYESDSESESESDIFNDSESDEESNGALWKRRKIQKQTKVSSNDNVVGWQVKRNPIIEDGDMATVASNYFKRILAKHYWHIQAIKVDVANIDLFDMKIERLPYLDDLNVSNMVAFCYFITRTSKNLKSLTLNSGQDKWLQTSMRSVMSFQQIYEVSDWFHVSFESPRNLELEKVLNGVENIELDSKVYHLKYNTLENTQVFRTINNVDENSYMDIVYSNNDFVLAVNNEKSNLRTKEEKPSHACDIKRRFLMSEEGSKTDDWNKIPKLVRKKDFQLFGSSFKMKSLIVLKKNME